MKDNYLSISMLLVRFFCCTAMLIFVLPVNAATAADAETLHNPFIPGISSREDALSLNEPIYLVFGGSGDIKGRFQYSFKYRVFDEESDVVHAAPWLKGFHFAYTQTSLWNISADSLPFEDSSYRPSFFWDFEVRDLSSAIPENDYWPDLIRTGYEHESNGRDDPESRSIDTFIFWPFWSSEQHTRSLTIAPKFYGYFSKGEFNEDIADYRGYMDLLIRYGSEDDWLVSTTIRRAGENRNMVQLDVSFPVRKNIFYRSGGYIYVQLFHGYGESLITYNEKQSLQFRIGFAIVR